MVEVREIGGVFVHIEWSEQTAEDALARLHEIEAIVDPQWTRVRAGSR